MPSESGRVSVLLAESGTSVGGTERVVWELATRLAPARFDVSVWLSGAPGVDEFARVLEARGVPVARVPEVDSRWDFRGMWDTWKRLRRARPRLLHLHHVWPASDRYLAALAGAAGIPHVVVTEHIVGRAHSGAQRALKRRELAGADAVTAVCEAVAATLVSDYGVDRARVRVEPNGAELPDLDAETPEARTLRAQFGASAARPLLVCAARLEEQKGQDVLLEAGALLRARGLDCTLALAGDGSQRAALEARAAALGIADRVRFLGQIETIGPLLLAADAVVLPSRWEGLPLALLEALARARPVVASAVGGIPEVITTEEHGILVPPGDAAALAAAVELFQRRPDMARRLGEAGARRVRETYTWARVTEQFEAVYDEVLGLASFAPRAAGRGARGSAA